MKKETETEKKTALAAAVSARLTERYPAAECALRYEGDAWRLLVMGRLSAQCTDKRVNEVSPALFAEIPTPAAAAAAPVGRIEELIRSCGLYRTKARNIRDCGAVLTERFGGRVPEGEAELLSLPGVGRKIANLVRGDLWRRGGVVVDTHFIRVCGRLGFYPEKEKDPARIERIFEPLVAEADRSDFCHRIVLFGREYCSARAPRCGECPLSSLCSHFLRAEK